MNIEVQAPNIELDEKTKAELQRVEALVAAQVTEALRAAGVPSAEEIEARNAEIFGRA